MFSVEGAEKFLDFLRSAFDAKDAGEMRKTNGGLVHAEVTIGDSRLMIDEADPKNWPAIPSRIYLYLEGVDATYRSALRAGAIAMREPSDRFYGDRNAIIKDPFGNIWTISTHIEDVSEAELKRRIASLPEEE
jgi:PhnB protein